MQESKQPWSGEVKDFIESFDTLDLSHTIAVPYWNDKDQDRMHLMFDPWASRNNAFVTHSHYHTTWAEHIHTNYLMNNLRQPANFNWKGKTVILVGRGASKEQYIKFLEAERDCSAIFLNHAFADVKTQPQDFCMCADNRAPLVTQGNWWENARNISLITFPGISLDILRLPWRSVYGFVFWPQAPLNDWMRKLYPYFPQLDDTQCIASSALHLVALSKAKTVILVGFDYTHPAGDLTCAIHASVVTRMAMLCNKHTGLRIINASPNSLVGMHITPEGVHDRQPWFEFITDQEELRNVCQ